MSYQRRLLPSTSMLMAFDAAARTGSFTAAARELHLTQGAVSRQVSALENQLDAPLFQRIGKTVALTETGATYAREIHSALQAIRSASLSAMTDPLNGLLNLAILPTLSTGTWKPPRRSSTLPSVRSRACVVRSVPSNPMWLEQPCDPWVLPLRTPRPLKVASAIRTLLPKPQALHVPRFSHRHLPTS